jgi:hypothetical protein
LATILPAWLNLNQIAELFGRDKSVVSRQLRNIFKTKELKKSRVVVKNATTAAGREKDDSLKSSSLPQRWFKADC